MRFFKRFFMVVLLFVMRFVFPGSGPLLRSRVGLVSEVHNGLYVVSLKSFGPWVVRLR